MMVFLMLGLMQVTILGQKINVLQTVIIVDIKPQKFTAPQFSPDGKRILFSEFGYRGLWIYDLAKKQTFCLNDLPGAGYAPVFSSNGELIYFETDTYVNSKRYSSLATQSIADKQIQYLIKEERYLFPVRLLADETVVYRQNNEIKYVSRLQKAAPLSKPLTEVIGYSEGTTIILFINGIRKELTPFGHRHYIWFSLSPDQNRMLFTVAGGGTFICDLEAKVLVQLGKAHAPRWSPDGQWIVYMVDEDDGHTYTASDLWVVSSDGLQKLQLTSTINEIEMFPAWSPALDKIVFETMSGKIAYLNIEIK